VFGVDVWGVREKWDDTLSSTIICQVRQYRQLPWNQQPPTRALSLAWPYLQGERPLFPLLFVPREPLVSKEI